MNKQTCDVIENLSIYLSPGTGLTIAPSFVTHVTVGDGEPCAEHDICDPLSLLNIKRDIGSCRNIGACWPSSISEASVIILISKCD